MRVAPKGVVAALAFLAGLSIVVFLANSNASAVNHGQLVDDQARFNLPIVLDGDVYAHAQVGNRIFVGGDFQQVERPDGSVITQAYVFAYDINTGLLDENFRPVVNNPVYALEASPNEDALYAGGRFTNWDGDWVGRLAKLSPQGVNDPQFVGKANALVRDLAVTNTNVYMAGNFVTVNDTHSRIGFAAVNRQTGAIDTGFVFNVEDSVLNNQYGRGIVVNPAQNRVFGLHFGREINGVDREAVVKININNNTMQDWEIDWSGQAGRRECLEDLRDIAIAPDNSFIVIGGQGADNAPNCDSVLRYEAGATGVVPYTWSARMYSSVFSLAVSDVAVYAGGHFCAAPKNGAPPGGITHDPNTGPSGTANKCDTGNPNSSVNPSVIFPTEAVFRNQMAALNPTNGQALAWDPGSNNQLAVFDLTLIDRGLLAGHDNNRFSNRNVGRSGFFDFGVPPDTTDPTIDLVAPADGVVVNAVSSITGTAEDDRGVTAVIVRLRNLDTGQWLQANGTTFGGTQANLPVTLTSTGVGTVDWSVNLPNLSPAEYQIRAFSRDAAFNTSVNSLTTFRIAGATNCTVALNANNDVVVTYSDFNNVANVQIRRDGSWISADAAGSGSYTDTSVTPGSTYSYEVRWKPNGSNVDVACTPTSITVPAGDTTPPNATFTSPTTLTTGNRTLAGGVTDNASGIQAVRVNIRNNQTGDYWNGNSWVSAWSWNLANVTGNNWSLPVNLNPAGTYTVKIWAWDTAGNRSVWQDNASPTLTVGSNDTTPPDATFTSPTTLTTGNRTLAGGVTDNASGIQAVRVNIRNNQTGDYWNGNSWVSAWSWNLANVTGNNWSLPVNLNPAGTYTVKIWAWDTAGNRSAWQDNANPTLTVQ